jgi:hypothetical protein
VTIHPEALAVVEEEVAPDREEGNYCIAEVGIGLVQVEDIPVPDPVRVADGKEVVRPFPFPSRVDPYLVVPCPCPYRVRGVPCRYLDWWVVGILLLPLVGMLTVSPGRSDVE